MHSPPFFFFFFLVYLFKAGEKPKKKKTKTAKSPACDRYVGHRQVSPQLYNPLPPQFTSYHPLIYKTHYPSSVKLIISPSIPHQPNHTHTHANLRMLPSPPHSLSPPFPLPLKEALPCLLIYMRLKLKLEVLVVYLRTRGNWVFLLWFVFYIKGGGGMVKRMVGGMG